MLAVKLLYCQTPDFTARTLLQSVFGISLAPIFSLVMTDAPETRDERYSMGSVRHCQKITWTITLSHFRSNGVVPLAVEAVFLQLHRRQLLVGYFSPRLIEIGVQ